MRPFLESTSLLATPESLRARLAESGYLYFSKLVDPVPLQSLGSEIADIMVDSRWIDGQDPDALEAIRAATVEGDEDHYAVYQKIQRLESFNALPHRPEISAVMNNIFDGPNFVHPLAIARLTFPFAEAFSTPAHQDYPNNQGTPDLFACWMPLHDCATTRGPLKILAGSNQLGLQPVDVALGAGSVTTRPSADLDSLEWHASDMEVGDALIFHSHTVHAAMANTTERMRLSVDYRFQRDGEKLTSGCLLPHFGRQSWDEIYSGWKSNDLKYYWEKHDYEIVEFDSSIREISVEQGEQAVVLARDFREAQIALAKANGWPAPQNFIDQIKEENAQFRSSPTFLAALKEKYSSAHGRDH